MVINEIDKSCKISFKEPYRIDAAPEGEPLDYRDLNARVYEAVNANYKKIIINNVCGQRFIGAALQKDVEIIINGIPGNDLGIFMDGPKISVYGNCEDQSGNTMNNGMIIVKGDGGDVIGLSSRGGKIYIKGNVGYRVGIHMKEYKNQFPVIIVGGTTKDFLGEYMAGGIIIVLGLKFLPDGSIIESDQPICGNELGTGIHRGTILLRTEENLKDKLGVGAKISDNGDIERTLIVPYLIDFCNTFDIPLDLISYKSFKVIKPISKRPFRGTYCNLSI